MAWQMSYYYIFLLETIAQLRPTYTLRNIQYKTTWISSHTIDPLAKYHALATRDFVSTSVTSQRDAIPKYATSEGGGDIFPWDKLSIAR